MRMAAKRKVNGEGTIVQLEKDKPRGKCRKWQLRVSTGRDPKTGKYKTKTRRVCGTYTQAQAGLRAFIAEIEGGEVAVKRTGNTLAEACADYLARREASGRLTQNTLEGGRTHLKAVCRHLGCADVAAITARDVEDMYAAMRAGDTESGRPASGTYLHDVHAWLRMVFSDLVDDGTLAASPLDKMQPPSKETKEKRALAPERMRAFIAELDCAGESECAYFLAATLGLRRGEVCGLSWEDVDFERGVVSVRHSLDRFGNLKGPKTRSGRRDLPMPPVVAEGLMRHKRAQAEHLSKLDPPVAQTGDTAVIQNRKGQRMPNYTLGHNWGVDRASLGVEGLHFHELRHSYLSMLAAQGVHPKVMQELAGHSSSQITMDIYTHVVMDQKRAAAAAVQAAMAGPAQSASAPAPAAAGIGHATRAASPQPQAAQARPGSAEDVATARPAFTVIKCAGAARPAAKAR